MKRTTLVTRGPWNFGGMSGSGITGLRLQPFRLIEGNRFRDGKCRFLHGQLYGLHVPLDGDRGDALGLTYGYLQPYNRNLCRFVMSRAARKRGYKSDCPFYNRRAAEKRG